MAVAEVDSKKRRHFATLHGLKEENVFADWREVIRLADAGKRLQVDGVLLCTLDWQHTEVCALLFLMEEASLIR